MMNRINKNKLISKQTLLSYLNAIKKNQVNGFLFFIHSIDIKSI